ncbi:unnamed protein product [Leptidea sinapis]|uniref:Uncharacterized protein n=1 Tax=Leptidea sinapis TaxID=189913 RepID=A0A5E4QRY6_9NEOP|nr:unnamed protein product [Leptidea sinapis]
MKYRRCSFRRDKISKKFVILAKPLSIGRVCRHRWNHVWKKTAARFASWSKSPSKLTKRKNVLLMQNLQRCQWDSTDVQTALKSPRQTAVRKIKKEKFPLAAITVQPMISEAISAQTPGGIHQDITQHRKELAISETVITEIADCPKIEEYTTTRDHVTKATSHLSFVVLQVDCSTDGVNATVIEDDPSFLPSNKISTGTVTLDSIYQDTKPSVVTEVGTYLETKTVDCFTAPSLYRRLVKDIGLGSVDKIISCDESTSVTDMEKNNNSSIEMASINCGSHLSLHSFNAEFQPESRSQQIHAVLETKSQSMFMSQNNFLMDKVEVIEGKEDTIKGRDIGTCCDQEKLNAVLCLYRCLETRYRKM